MGSMKRAALAFIMILIVMPLKAYALNPQIFYKSVYVYGSEEYVDPVMDILGEVMLLDSNVKLIDEIRSKNDLTGVDILIYVPQGNDIGSREIQLVSEWILLGGKLLLVFAPDSKEEESNVNELMEAIGSSIRFKYFYSGHILTYRFEVFGEVNEYRFDPEIYNLELRISVSSLVYTVKDDYIMGSGGLVFIGDTKVPWILVEYLAAYSDLFTWYYSKIIGLSFSVDSISQDDDFKTLFIELLSLGITPYLNPNLYSISLTLLTGFLAVAAYASVKIYG